MTRDERWDKHWKEIMGFMDHNDRNPSKYKPEERNMINWLKAQRKERNAGKLSAERVTRLKVITDRMEQLHRRNQHTPPAYRVNNNTTLFDNIKI